MNGIDDFNMFIKFEKQEGTDQGRRSGSRAGYTCNISRCSRTDKKGGFYVKGFNRYCTI